MCGDFPTDSLLDSLDIGSTLTLSEAPSKLSNSSRALSYSSSGNLISSSGPAFTQLTRRLIGVELFFPTDLLEF